MKKKSHKVAPLLNQTMSNQPKTTQQGHVSPYPEHTEGTKIAANARKEGNNWTEQKRSELFEQGMRIIYGGSNNHKTKVCSR